MNIKDLPKVLISKLKPFPGNPRDHGEEDISALARSIKVFGFTNPPLVQLGTDRIVAGHGRIEAAKMLGMKSVPVIYLEMADPDADAYTIADNRLAENSRWNFPKLNSIMAELSGKSYDVTLTGFSLKEIEEMITFDPSPRKTEEPQEQSGKAQDRTAICPRCKHEFEV